MNKYIIIFLFLICFFSLKAQKDSVIVLPKDVGLQVLKDIKTLPILENSLSLRDSIITVLRYDIKERDTLIFFYKLKQNEFTKLITVKDSIINNYTEIERTYKDEVGKLNKDIKRHKKEKVGIGILALLGIILAAL